MSKRGWMVFSLAAAVAAAGCASDDWQSKYEESQRTLLQTTTDLTDAKQQRAEQAAKAEQYATQLKESDMAAQKAQQAADALAKQNDELRQSAVSRPAAASGSSSGAGDSRALEAAAQAFEREGPKGTTVAVTKDGNIEITLPSDVTFPSGSSDLSEAGKKSLRAVVPLLKGKYAPYQIRVEGHTDATPITHHKEYKDNFGLGSARALAVVRFMEKDLGVEPTRLMSASRGEHEPVADNKTDTGKKQNRRVAIVVVVPRDAAMSMSK